MEGFVLLFGVNSPLKSFVKKSNFQTVIFALVFVIVQEHIYNVQTESTKGK